MPEQNRQRVRHARNRQLDWSVVEARQEQLRRGELGKSNEALEAALRLGPAAFAPRLNYGILLIYQRDYRAAAGQLQRAVETESSSAAGHYYFGRSLTELGIYGRALTELKRAIEIGGNDSLEAHRYLGAIYLETGEHARAAEELETYLRLAPSRLLKKGISPLRHKDTKSHQVSEYIICRLCAS